VRKGLSCDGSFIFTTLWDDLRDVFPEMTTGCLAKIESAAGKAKLLQQWRAWKGLQ